MNSSMNAIPVAAPKSVNGAWCFNSVSIVLSFKPTFALSPNTAFNATIPNLLISIDESNRSAT